MGHSRGGKMLLNLHVKNLALIKDIDVDFGEGLIVLTGETGAGKSLILGSVNIALGNKASKELIRNGSDFALVELTFLVDDVCAKKIKEQDIYIDSDNIVTVSRKITENRSVAKINGETVNLSLLKQIMGLLIDIHGQHDHQSLLYTDNHRKILDKFAFSENNNFQLELKEEYKNYKRLQNKLSSYNMDESKRTREIEFAEYEIGEINAANLLPNEDTIIEERYKKLSNGKDIISTLSYVYNCVSSENESSAGELINRAIQEIGHIQSLDQRIEQFQNSLYDIDAMCRDLSAEISDYNRNLEVDPKEVIQAEERLNTINHLKLKYGKTIDDIIDYGNQKQQYLEQLYNYENEITNLKNKITKTKDNLEKICDKISKTRKDSALKLEKLIVDALVDLNFLSVNFKINISKNNNITENGYDNVEFMISTNPGEPMKPLSKVASGGELSRIMLAIKSILAKEDDIDTLIFDEIDTGISGKTALLVAEKLASISRKHQVLCISHLSQIAAMADHHYLIEKNVDDQLTSTTIKKLNEQESIAELVRINGGIEVTDAALIHAKEMKEMADRTKCNLI